MAVDHHPESEDLIQQRPWAHAISLKSTEFTSRNQAESQNANKKNSTVLNKNNTKGLLDFNSHSCSMIIT